MNNFTKQNSSLSSLPGNIGIQMNNTVYTSKEKNYWFSSKKKPSPTIHSPRSSVYNMEFYRNFLFEYSLMDNVKPKFTRRNEIWCSILEIEVMSKNMRKTQDLKICKYKQNVKYSIIWHPFLFWFDWATF